MQIKSANLTVPEKSVIISSDFPPQTPICSSGQRLDGTEIKGETTSRAFARQSFFGLLMHFYASYIDFAQGLDASSQVGVAPVKVALLLLF